MPRFLMIITMMLFMATGVSAGAISGRVVDPEGNPLESVSVVTNLSGVGAQTDREGNFSIEGVDEASRVTFSAVGYRARQYRIDQVPATVILEPVYIQ